MIVQSFVCIDECPKNSKRRSHEQRGGSNELFKIDDCNGMTSK